MAQALVTDLIHCCKEYQILLTFSVSNKCSILKKCHVSSYDTPKLIHCQHLYQKILQLNSKRMISIKKQNIALDVTKKITLHCDTNLSWQVLL